MKRSLEQNAVNAGKRFRYPPIVTSIKIDVGDRSVPLLIKPGHWRTSFFAAIHFGMHAPRTFLIMAKYRHRTFEMFEF